MSVKTSYRERDHIYGEAMLKLRTAIGLTQGRLGNLLGISGRTVGEWEAGGSYPKTEHLKKLIALAVQHQAFAPGNETAEIRVLWKVAHQRILLDEQWLSALLSEQRDPLPHMAEVDQARAGELASPAPAPVLQNLPFPPNPFFTGREGELLLMSQLFEQSARIAITQPVSISGLGGIGKTQLALEYAHRCHPNIYQCVFWINAADTATLEASYLALAHLLKLPEEKEREINPIVQAVNNWLEKYPRWLLILDNADDLELARSFLPTKPRGHILLTTRSQIVGTIATVIQVETLSPQAGLLFLLRRSGVLRSGTEGDGIATDIRYAAAELVEMLSGHPLALDQAGAYIEETSDPDARAYIEETSDPDARAAGEASSPALASPALTLTAASFTEYRLLYQERRRMLLKRRGALGGEHPESVALTFEISMQKACGLHPNCAEVLAFCSLLHPDAIPEELLHQGLCLDLLHLNEVIRALRSYSLIKRNAQKQVLSLHRLVQAVIRDGMDRQTESRWTACVVQVVNEAFPEVTFEEWKKCERYLPHVLLLVNAPLQEVLPAPQVSHLLTKAGIYLRERGQYRDAEPLMVRALALREQCLGPDHPGTAQSLNRLANLYRRQGKYDLAEPLYQRSLLIYEQHKHPDTAKCLNNLANLYQQQGKYELAEPLYQRSLSIHEQHSGPEHLDTAANLNNLANLYRRQGKYELAESLYQRSLLIYKQHLGVEHPGTAKCQCNLADLYRQQGKYELAEPLYQRAISIHEQQLGAEHPDTAYILYGLAELYQRQGRYEQAEPLYQRILSIFEQCMGAEHPCTAAALHGLAELYEQQGRYEQAEPLYQRALSIREERLGPHHPDTEVSRKAYAALGVIRQEK